MSILAEVGIKVGHNIARELFMQAGAQGDEETFAVKIPEQLVRWAMISLLISFLSTGVTRNSNSNRGRSGCSGIRLIGYPHAYR